MPNIYLPIVNRHTVPVVGVQTWDIPHYTKYLGPHSFVHYQISWDDAHQPTPGADFLWPDYIDRDFELLRPWKVMLGIRNTPTWAREYPPAICSAPKAEYVSAYAMYVKAACERHHPWMVCVWNEPEVGAEEAEKLDADAYLGGFGLEWASRYGEMVAAVYDAINPLGIPVVAGELMLADVRFWEIARQSCQGKYDYVSFHAYSEWLSAWGEVERKATLLKALGDQDLICTETNYLWHVNDTHDPTFDQDQANYLQYLLDHFDTLGVQKLTVFAMNSGWRGANLVDENGPRPIHSVYLKATS